MPGKREVSSHPKETVVTGQRARQGDAREASLLFGGSAGTVVLSRANLAISPGVTFMRSDVDEYGSYVGVSAPVEWVFGVGLRLGLEASVGVAFGGTNEEVCEPPGCTDETRRTLGRDTSSGAYLHFQIGWGIGHPDPLPDESTVDLRSGPNDT